MKRLIEAVGTFQETCLRHDQNRQAFEDPESAGLDLLDAREAFFAYQPTYEAARHELVQIAQTLQVRGRLISNYDRLPKDLRAVMLRALREEGQEDLLDTRRKIRSFSELVQPWYLAKQLQNIAQELRDARFYLDDQEFDRLLATLPKRCGESGEFVLANYEDALESFKDDGANSWDAVRVVFNDALRSFEDLSEEIIEAAARSRAEGSWKAEIRNLDRDIWTALRSYIERHTRQPLPQEDADERADPRVDLETIDL
jgi:hypothetical protein